MNKRKSYSVVGVHFSTQEKKILLQALKSLNEREGQYGKISLAGFVRTVVMKEVDAIIKKGA